MCWLITNSSRICFFLNKLQKYASKKHPEENKDQYLSSWLSPSAFSYSDRQVKYFVLQFSEMPAKKLHIRIQRLIRCLTDFLCFWNEKQSDMLLLQKQGEGRKKKDEVQLRDRLKSKLHETLKKKKKKSVSAQFLAWASNKDIQPINRHESGAKHPVRFRARRLSG